MMPAIGASYAPIGASRIARLGQTLPRKNIEPSDSDGPGDDDPKERIAMRAYEKWLKGGCKHGRDQQDWIEAEKELRAEMAKAPAGATTRR
jgi:hypothetical protein